MRSVSDENASVRGWSGPGKSLRISALAGRQGCLRACMADIVNSTIFDRYGDADDFLDCFIMPAHIVGGTFQG